MSDIVKISIDNFDYTIDGEDLILVGDSSLQEPKDLIIHHLNSTNNFYTHGISNIITQGFKIERTIQNKRANTPEDANIEKIFCEVIPTDIQLLPPRTLNYLSDREIVLYPKMALMRDKTYSGVLLISCQIKAVAHLKNGTTIERTANIKSFKICKVPIIKGSIMCNTYGQSKEALMQLGEDPSDPGGYFVVKGEWVVENTESMTFNLPKIYINEGYGKNRVRCDFLSKPGDHYQNQHYSIMRYSNDETFTVEVARENLLISNLHIPFYLMFRALGWNTDKEMMDWIIYDYENPANKKILTIINKALNAKYGKFPTRQIYNQIDAIKAIIEMAPEENFKFLDLENKPENYNYAITEILKTFDVYYMPHIGTNESSRHEKLKFLGYLIRKTLLVYLKYIPQTDRDSYRNKRILSTGDNYAKAFKTYFNQTIVMPIKRKMLKEFNNTSFQNVNLENLVKGAIYADDFERLIVQTIISGNRSNLKIKKKVIVNRLATQLLQRKNQLYVISALRQITATGSESANHSERALEMRRIHMSSVGYICVSQSPPEGEKVGINKQMTLFAKIAMSSSSEVLKKVLLKDPDILTGNISPETIYKNNYAHIFVNGYLIGYAIDSVDIINKYKTKRRLFEIHPHTSIFWDNTQNEVHFSVDVGRLIRPLFIVYNNKRDPDIVKLKKGKRDHGNATLKNGDYGDNRDNRDSGDNGAMRDSGDGKSNSNKSNSNEFNSNFEQGIAITQQDIIELYENKKTIDDLIREQKVEYISPEEQENCYVCPNFEQLTRDRYDELHEYTHCDIPQAIEGLAALTAPYGNHNQAPRVTFQSGQSKQTCGYYVLNWPHRIDKEAFLQYINETPLIKTLANKYIFPNGVNVMVAMMCYTGYNQEDSLIINKAAIDRGIFTASKFTNIKTDFEQKEELGTPDAALTDGLKSSNYSKLKDGIVKKGQHINTDDVIIGKYMPIPKGKNDKYLYVDHSVVYRDDEKAIVHNVVHDRNEDDELFVKVALRKIRPVSIGDKFSSRSGQKGVAACLLREADMPFNRKGERPALIFNPHGLPSRMTVAQLIESLLGNLCAIKGQHHDATMYKKVDIESIASELEQYGYNRYGYDKLISGITGEFIDVDIYFGPTFYQRLQKFVVDGEYSVRHASTDAITFQPLSGKGSNGGLRVGEMERDVLASHGVSRFLNEKFFKHADGYTEYICRCGKAAVVNHKLNKYKCYYCKDNAVISAVETSWSAKLFNQELNSCNVSTRRYLAPYQFEIYDTPDRSLSQIETYDENNIKKLYKAASDMVDDSNSKVDYD
jgi:DNA-directed RNA polymerase beta subunit